ncbi:FecR family protein [Membranihabitans marinus]|uniref:FecR family protein n=1 Tax=Membranihabitans marinus TaxID=1227546 RepID=UPI001F2F2477|nr:FecR domain-containing protein [Membranihabitans marinus]
MKNNIEKILSDPFFAPYVDQGLYSEYWENWKVEHPDMIELLYDAIAVKRGLPVRNQMVNDGEAEAGFERLKAAISQKNRRIVIMRWSAYAAASIVLLMGLFYFMNSPKTVEVSLQEMTLVGEIKEVGLPDSSSVILNGNTTISYTSDIANDVRRVELDGEAHFSVRKHYQDGQPQKFVVQTSNAQIEVLGTTFSVSTDSVWTTVVLEEGSVQLRLGSIESAKIKTILMTPGEKVVYNNLTGQIDQHNIDAISYNLWTENKLALVDRSLDELIRWFGHTYNIELDLPSKYLDRKLTGTIATDNSDTAIKMIGAALGLEVKKITNTKWEFK